MKIVTAAQMREIDLESDRRGTPTAALMENAGRAVAEETRQSLGALRNQKILCLIGAGNNGGDGLVAARYLHKWGAMVSIYLCAPRPVDDPNVELAWEYDIATYEATDDESWQQLDELLAGATCVIDALLGTGKMRPLQGVFKQVLEKVGEEKKRRDIFIVAVDLPSGMDADSGAVDSACLYADLTVTLAFPKPGLFLSPGVERVGKLKIADIGLDESLAGDVKTRLLTGDWAGEALPARPVYANKGTFGRVMVVAGSSNYIGAACLACNGAYRVGAGLVTLATARSIYPILAGKLTEVTYLPLPETATGAIAEEAAGIVLGECGKYSAMLIGCGLGQGPAAVAFITSLLGKDALPPLVIDADGLNIISKIGDWPRKIKNSAVLTPHPGEMARLCGLAIEEVQHDRINLTVKQAKEWQKTIVLKGAYTVIGAPDGRCFISPYANPGLASAGTGDVLAGVIAGLVAQGLPLFEAAALGVCLHGEAGEIVKCGLGDTGMVASDLLTALPQAIKRLKEGNAVRKSNSAAGSS